MRVGWKAGTSGKLANKSFLVRREREKKKKKLATNFVMFCHDRFSQAFS